MQKDNSDILAMRCLEFKYPPCRRLTADQRIYHLWLCVKYEIHKVTPFICLELIMRPEGVVEGEVTMLTVFRIVCIKESGHGSLHIDAEPTVEVGLSLIEGSNSNSYFHTHKLRINTKLSLMV